MQKFERKNERDSGTQREKFCSSAFYHTFLSMSMSMSIYRHVLFRVRWHFVDVVFTFTPLLIPWLLPSSRCNHTKSLYELCVCVPCKFCIHLFYNFSIYRMVFLYILWLASTTRPLPFAIFAIFVLPDTLDRFRSIASIFLVS